MIYTKNKVKEKEKEKKKVKGIGKYQSVSEGNTIISFYCPIELQNVLDDRRGKVSRSVFIVDLLSKHLGVDLKQNAS